MRVLQIPLVVFVASLIALSWNVRAVRVASAYTDPVVPILAQDESVYISSAQAMLTSGHWLTPRVLSRFTLAKPPLLQWFSAVCAKLFGMTLLSFRLPSLLAGALGVTVIFTWALLERGVIPALVSGLLLLSSTIWFTFSRLCYTDTLAAALVLLALFALYRDPGMIRVRTPVLFGVCVGMAVLTRSVAGFIPLLVLGLYRFVATPPARPAWTGTLWACVVTAAVVLPWYAYQAATHGRWLWAESVGHQLVDVGLLRDTGVAAYPFFYLRRLLAMDPVLSVFAAIGLAGAWQARKRWTPALAIVTCWLAVTAVSLWIFRGRSVSYLVLLVPGLCLLAALLLPRTVEHRWKLVLPLLVATCVIRVAYQENAWSLRLSAPRMEGAAAMRWYYGQGRGAELVIAEPNEQFYSMTLPGLRLRYCFLDPDGLVARTAPHFVGMGITLTPDALSRLPELLPTFRLVSRQWGLETEDATGRAVALKQVAQFGTVVAALPQADYYLPASWQREISPQLLANFDAVPTSDRVFLLARTGAGHAPPPWTLPDHW